MSWIKLQTNIWDNPKIDYLTHEVGLPLEMVVGIVSRLWSWFDQHTEEGETDKIGKAKVNRIIVTSVTQLRDKCNAIDVESVTNNFIECLKYIGWIAENDQNGYTLPKWGEHNGATAKKRATDTKRQQNHRLKRGGVTTVTQERDESVTREEKRREENNTPLPPTGVAENVPALDNFLSYCQVSGGHLGLSDAEWIEMYNNLNFVGWVSPDGKPIASWKHYVIHKGRQVKAEKQKQLLNNPTTTHTEKAKRYVIEQ